MNTPKLRFKDETGTKFPDWNKRRLEEILTIYNGKDYKDLKSGEFPVFGTGGVITFVDKYLCNWNCVCIGRKGTINKPIFMDEPFWCVDTLFYTKPKEKNNPKFQFYLFETIDWQKYNTATGVPSLTGTTIGNIIVEIPTIFEQNKIADFLSLYDEKISIQRERVEALERRKKGLLQKVFSQEIRFKADDGSKFPEWENLNTLDLLKDEKGSIKIGPFGSALKKECFVTKGKKVFAQENVFRNDFKCGKQYVTEEKYNELIGCKLETGDIVISTMGTVGACAIFPKDAEEGIMNSHLLRIRVDKNRVIAEFIAQSIRNAGYIKKQIEILAVGSIMTGLSSSIVQKLIFKLPSLQEQQKIADFFTAIDDQINIEKERLTTMETIKKGLLQGLFC